MRSEIDFLAGGDLLKMESGSFKASAPSNIALVKYWGKKPNQIPANPSISLTLDSCKTITSLDFQPKLSAEKFSFDFTFEGQAKESFRPKIAGFFERIESYMPFLKSYHFSIDSSNTFPHSSGIASSASSMAALSVNLMQLERALNPQISEEYFWQKASFLARLGSGSACRSLRGKVIEWGLHRDFEGSSDLFGIEFPGSIHENFKTFQDTILLVDSGEKSISSTLGHDLMTGHPFADKRFLQAHKNLSAIKNVLETGDLQAFVSIVESEALTLHAMMMCSNPYFILMKPNTLEIINRIWKFRSDTKIPACFTLDAGANVHVLYPMSEKESVLQFIRAELVAFCQQGKYLCDQIGNGAELL